MSRRTSLVWLLLASVLPASAASLVAGGGAATDVAAIERFDAEVRSLVERAALDAAQASVDEPDRFEVLSYRFGGVDPTPLGAARVEPLEIEGPNAAGFVRLRFRLLVDDVPRGEARATVRGEVHGPALVALRTLTRGRPVGADAVGIAEVDLTRVLDPPLRDPARLVDQVPVRSLGAGRVLTAALLQAAPVVHRGDPVELKIERHRLTVIARGTVLSDGAPGEMVAAENVTTGARVMARVQDDGSLLVVRRGGGGSR